MTSEPTIFERIIAREIPADIIFESQRIMAITDIAPQAPVHLLIFPKSAGYRNVVELAAGDAALLAEMVAAAERLAAERTDGQFRLVFNTGPAAGQTVFHVHAHLLGGTLTEGSLAQH